jgi:lysophospholipase
MATIARHPESEFDRRRHPAGMRFPVWTAADGWPHRAYRWPAAGAVRGNLLFQSGRADFIEKYLEACAHWHEQGWAIEGFDWRGQGGSRRSATGRLPDDRLIVAHSMGAHVALRACAERGVTVDALVLVAPMLALNTRLLPTIAARAMVAAARLAGLGSRAAWRDNLQSPRRQLRLTGSRERYEDSQWWKQATPGLALGPPSWNWLGAALAGARRITKRGELERVRIPTLLLAAGLDKLVKRSAIERAAARLPDAEFVAFPTGRHELLREADGDRSAALAAIDDFLDRRAPGP